MNDGSTDNSLCICENYKEKDNRVSVFSKTNGGCASARAMGVSMANGVWICFVDSDDTLPDNSLEILYKNTSEDSDIIVGFSFETDGKTYKESIEDWRRSIIKSDIILCTPWGKLFRNGVITKESCTLLSPSKVASDMIMNIRVSYSTLRDVTIVNRQVYNYNKHNGSLSTSARWDFDRLSHLYDNVLGAIPKGETEKMLVPLIENRFAHLKRIFTEHNYSREKNPSTCLFFSHLQEDIKRANYPLKGLQFFASHCPFCIITPILYVISNRLTISKEFIIRILSRQQIIE